MWAVPQMCRNCRCYSSSLEALSRKTVRDMGRFRIVENRRFDGKRATKSTRHAYDYWSNRLGDIERAIWKERMIIVIMV